MTIFDFSKFVFSTSKKLSGNQRTYLYSGGSGLSIDIHFVDIELSYDILSPLPTLLSKHFNHPHPYIEIATAISVSNKNLILKYFRCRDGKRIETRIGMEGIFITHSYIPPLWAIMCCLYIVYSEMQEWVIQIPSIPILVSILFPSLHLE